MVLKTALRKRRQLVSLLTCSALAAFITACGGGDGGNTGTLSTQSSGSAFNLALEPGAPAATGNTAADGITWFNYRRQQIGLSALARDAQLDRSAQAHSDYQRLNNVITHDETAGSPGFTGADLGQRIAAAGYTFTSNRYAYGEVISATASTSGYAAAEDLITAIYHRFVIFEPTFFQAGGGSASVSGGYTYFTANFTADGLGRGLGRGQIVTYPRDAQTAMPTNFFSDREVPDPVPDRNEVGFPISVHADISSNVVVSSFTVCQKAADGRCGSPLATKLLTSVTDKETPTATAAIIPMAPLAGGSVHEVHFVGTVDGTAVDKTWTFTTR